MSPPLSLNPMHVADEGATLDLLAGGNYILGVGLVDRLPQRQVLSLIQRPGEIFASSADLVFGGEQPEVDRHLRRW
jgi:alkanesulfonate monooxygenase SsuD/methylene tetrahydromethanopterin reductase-like flavin-dependent oxidoreductase (luciferase family)